MYNRAKELAQSTDDKVCIRDFQIAISEMHAIEWNILIVKKPFTFQN